MINYIIAYSDVFEKEVRKLSAIDQKRVLGKIALIADNPFHPSLRSKKLRGYADYFESSVNMDIRLIWQFRGNRVILILDVGHHDILKKY